MQTAPGGCFLCPLSPSMSQRKAAARHLFNGYINHFFKNSSILSRLQQDIELAMEEWNILQADAEKTAL